MFKSFIITGGTTFPIRPHLSLCAPAFGTVGKQIYQVCAEAFKTDADKPELWMHHLCLTKMAGGRYLKADSSPLYYDTNADVAALVDEIIADPETRVVFMPVALCDFDVKTIESRHWDDEIGVYHSKVETGKSLPRLKTSDYLADTDHGEYEPDNHEPEPTLRLGLIPADKIIGRIRKTRKDIFLVGFKTTTGATEQEQFEAGLQLLKQSSCNLVLANDLHTKLNMVITPEQAKYFVGTDRDVAVGGLVKMTASRCCGEFTKSTVIPGDLVRWNSPEIPDSLRQVVNYAVKRGAYRPFLGATVGHFAVKVDNSKFLTSVRKTNFNNLDAAGLVKVEVADGNAVIAHGFKPSVGGASQRIIFNNNPEMDCIFHAHVKLRQGSQVPTVPQWPNECGSNACGSATANGLKSFGQIKAVWLENHGPNVVFNRNTDPELVIKFIEDNFILDQQTSE